VLPHDRRIGMAGINGYPGFISDFVRGTTKDFIISISRDGQPVDITGSKFYITFAYDQDPATAPALEIVIDPPTNPTEGKTLGEITDTDTWSLNAGSVYYSVRYINASGAAYVIDMAKIKVNEAISDQLD
jgi:hypothetical protein